MKLNCLQSLCKNTPIIFSSPPFSPAFHHIFNTNPSTILRYEQKRQVEYINIGRRRRMLIVANGYLLPVDPWAPNIDSQSIASQLFAFSLFPYIGFLYFITKSNSAPKLTLFGFYFLLAFVGATIPAGIYAKVQYGTSLSNVDYLHGGAESLLTLTNLFIVLGLRAAIRRAENEKETTSKLSPGIKETDETST